MKTTKISLEPTEVLRTNMKTMKADCVVVNDLHHNVLVIDIDIERKEVIRAWHISGIFSVLKATLIRKTV